MLASQTAIAIDNAELFENLQNTNSELMQAYDRTLEGWVHAMDLRDRETEGHSQRVAEITVRLAARLDIRSVELEHIRRGALLHDVGKMGIPDSILLKQGPLTEAEWKIMRKHPTFALEMLSSIEYLRKSLDIPQYHHEHWDGSGYPYGLANVDIPIAARIFCVVDVWDALTSDRPYRSAWGKPRAKQYLLDRREIQFDSRVVNEFISMLESGIIR
jgi:putative nucleotidyltransferase with HDIG domain